MDSMELTSLVERGQKGDTAAMEELLRVAYTPVSYQCRRFLRTGQDAEDMTQEVLLLLYTKLDTLKEPAAFFGWLGRLTANRCKNALSRTHTDLPILEDEDGNSVLDSIESEDKQTVPEEAFDNAETARMIGGIVDALPEAQRNCILLYYYDEMSVKEIAGVVGASENTVKSRLNYARRAIKDNVLDYERKQGIRLHSIAPLPLLLYFLRRTAEETTDQTAAKSMASKVMAQGAAMGGASIASGKAAGTAAGHAIKGISYKAIAGIAAGILVTGGIAAGVITLVNNDKPETVEETAFTVTDDDIAHEDTEDINTDEAAGPLEEETLFPAESIALLPYTGDADNCVMTIPQAEAFAEALDNCITKSREAGYNYQPFCRAALFDAGDGIPALFAVWGSDIGYGNDTGYMPNVSQVYFWDGEKAFAGYESHPNEEYIFSEDIANIALTDGGLLIDKDGWTGGVHMDISELYEISGGSISGEPAHTYEEFVLGSIPSEADFKAHVTEHGSPGTAYDYDTLAEDKWESYPEFGETGGRWREDGGYLIAALDGKFLTTEEAATARQTLIWYGAEWILGHGVTWVTDVSHYWTGNWMDAEELAALLRSGSDEPAADNDSVKGPATQEDAAIATNGNIRRTALDPRGYNMEIFYEAPVFEETGSGYQKINAAFQALQDEFFNAGLDDMWEVVEENPPTDESYYYTVSSEITAQTDKYISVAQRLDMFLGGIRGSETSYYNYRADTGEKLLLTDLLDGTEGQIKDMIADALEEFSPDKESLGRIRNRGIEDFNFYVTGGRVYVCFTPYEVYGKSYGPDLPIEAELPAGLVTEWE